MKSTLSLPTVVLLVSAIACLVMMWVVVQSPMLTHQMSAANYHASKLIEERYKRLEDYAIKLHGELEILKIQRDMQRPPTVPNAKKNLRENQ